MKIHAEDIKTALVLPGGGARGAFQVGVLKAIAEWLPRPVQNPFPIVSGTSAGAINSVVLASKARRFRMAIAEMDAVWSQFESDQVFRDDAWTMLKSSLHWLAAIVTGGLLVGTPKSLLNNSPLRDLLQRNIDFSQIQSAIDSGFLHAVAVTAAGYSSARSTTFFEAGSDCPAWSRKRRAGVATDLGLDHLMASIAVPMIFPPVLVGSDYYGDGAMRQATPLSPVIHLGADRILVIGVRDETSDPPHDPSATPEFPSFAHIAGYMLDTLFMDGLYSDLERMTRINQLLDTVPEHHRHGGMRYLRPIDTMIVLPSQDLRDIAIRHQKSMPRSIRLLMRGISGNSRSESRLLSFLLFEQPYTQELIALGYSDAHDVKDELIDFVCGRPVPRLIAPGWVSDDLSRFDINENCPT